MLSRYEHTYKSHLVCPYCCYNILLVVHWITTINTIAYSSCTRWQNFPILFYEQVQMEIPHNLNMTSSPPHTLTLSPPAALSNTKSSNSLSIASILPFPFLQSVEVVFKSKTFLKNFKSKRSILIKLTKPVKLKVSLMTSCELTKPGCSFKNTWWGRNYLELFVGRPCIPRSQCVAINASSPLQVLVAVSIKLGPSLVPPLHKWPLQCPGLHNALWNTTFHW